VENLWTLDLNELSSLNGFSIIYSFSVQLFDKTHVSPVKPCDFPEDAYCYCHC